jgi:hypothetical protein
LKTHILTGGIDWETEGLTDIKTNKMTTSLGGHFMQGGLALVLLYDYHHGKDFVSELGTRIDMRLSALTHANIQVYHNILEDGKWDRIDFKNLSKCYNSKRSKYNFDLKEIYCL